MRNNPAVRFVLFYFIKSGHSGLTEMLQSRQLAVLLSFRNGTVDNSGSCPVRNVLLLEDSLSPRGKSSSCRVVLSILLMTSEDSEITAFALLPVC